MITINDQNWQQFVEPPSGYARGALPRDYHRYPVGYAACAKAFDLPLIPENEWQERLEYQKATKSRLSDIRNRGLNGQPIPSTDQNGTPRGATCTPGAILRASGIFVTPERIISSFVIT